MLEVKTNLVQSRSGIQGSKSLIGTFFDRSLQKNCLLAYAAIICLGMMATNCFGQQGSSKNDDHIASNSVNQKLETEQSKADHEKTRKGQETSQPATGNSLKRTQRGESPKSIGIKGNLKTVILPYSGIKAKPIDPKDKVVVRIVGLWPDAAGGRYELEYFGLEKGEYNLAEYLVVPEGADPSSLPKIPVKVTSVVPEGRLLLDDLKPTKLPDFGYYWVSHYSAYAVWFVGLVLILFWGWKPRTKSVSPRQQKPPTWAQTLRPLFSAAQSGSLTAQQQAELERMLIAFWRDRLDLSGIPASVAMEKLAEDSQAGPSVKKLEQWIHSPADRRPNEDIEALLVPYQKLIQAEPVDRSSAQLGMTQNPEANITG